MRSAGADRGRPSCAHCRDAIGAYDALVYELPSGKPVRTSLAARPELEHLGTVFHAQCYALRLHIERAD